MLSGEAVEKSTHMGKKLNCHTWEPLQSFVNIDVVLGVLLSNLLHTLDYV